MALQKAQSGPITRDAINQALYEIGKRELRIETLEAEMNAHLDALKRDYSPDLEALVEEIGRLKRDLRLAVEDNRGNLFRRGVKSLAVLLGRVGFRTQPAAVQIVKGRTLDDVVRSASDRPGFIRERRELDKASILGAYRVGLVDDTELGRIGIEIRKDVEHWYFEPDRARVREEMARRP